MIRIILVGYMGSGKTTIGKALAQQLGISFYDLDWCIESRYHMTIPQIFDEKGEEGFREIEKRMLHEVCEFEDIVLSCGGGTPCFYDNMDYICSMGDVVYLKCTPEVLAVHLTMGKVERPLIKGKSSEELAQYINETLAVRDPFYSKAPYKLDVSLLNNFEQISTSVTLVRELLNV